MAFGFSPALFAHSAILSGSPYLQGATLHWVLKVCLWGTKLFDITPLPLKSWGLAFCHRWVRIPSCSPACPPTFHCLQTTHTCRPDPSPETSQSPGGWSSLGCYAPRWPGGLLKPLLTGSLPSLALSFPSTSCTHRLWDTWPGP